MEQALAFRRHLISGGGTLLAVLAIVIAIELIMPSRRRYSLKDRGLAVVITLLGFSIGGALVLPLQILSVAGYFRALYHLGGVVAKALGRVYGELWRQIVYAGLVIGGTVLGARHGLPGVAIGVSVAIVFMFVATGQLALIATGTPWRLYARVQRDALVIASVTAAAALVARLLLEGLRASNTLVTIGVLAAAAVPWTVGLLRTLRAPELDPSATLE